MIFLPVSHSDRHKALSLHICSYKALVPPSTAISAPVTHEASSDARYRAQETTSSVVPMRLIIICRVIPSMVDELMAHSVCGVLISPGEIVFARMLYVPPSAASCRVIAMTPPLLAAWA